MRDHGSSAILDTAHAGNGHYLRSAHTSLDACGTELVRFAGVPTLDGLGAVGEGAHAVNESILTNRMADRTALIAKLLEAL